MNVRELIERLSKCDPEAFVIVNTDEETLDEYPEGVLDGMDLAVIGIGAGFGSVTVTVSGVAEHFEDQP